MSIVSYKFKPWLLKSFGVLSTSTRCSTQVLWEQMKSFKDVRMFSDLQKLGYSLQKHLKCPWCIQESKRNSAPLKQSTGYHNRCFYFPFHLWMVTPLEGYPHIGWIRTVNIFCSLPFFPKCLLYNMVDDVALSVNEDFYNQKSLCPFMCLPDV